MDQDWVNGAVGARAEVRGFDMPAVDEIADAYVWQDAYVASIPGSVGGFKLAVNGAPQMAHFGVNEPVSARVMADEVYETGVALPRTQFMSVAVEPELCAVLNDGVADLSGPVDRAGAEALISRFHAAIELIDQRGVEMPTMKLPQAVALNVFNAGIVLGKESVAPDALDLPNMHVTLELDGQLTQETTGTPPQDPVEAVMWLVNSLIARGATLSPGMVVMCGTHIPIFHLAGHERDVRITMSGLGEVRFSLTD